MVDAELVLPDTGLGASGKANLGFMEYDATRSLDETAVYVWTFPPANTVFADVTPRVRLVTDDGRVLLDIESTPTRMRPAVRFAGRTPVMLCL